MIDFRIQRAFNRYDGYDIWICEYRNNKGYIAKPFRLEFQEFQEGCRLPEPSLEIAGPLSKEIMTAAKTAFAGLEWSSKEDYSHFAKVEKAMQAHIESLKLVVDRTVK